MSNVLELKLGSATEKRRKNVDEIMQLALKEIEEYKPEKVMVIIPYEDRPPEMMMAGLNEIEILGTLSFVAGLVTTMQTSQLADEISEPENEAEDAETPPED